MAGRLGLLLFATLLLVTSVAAADNDRDLASSMRTYGAARDVAAPGDATWPDLATPAPTQRNLIMPAMTPASAPRAAAGPAAAPAIGILAILAPAFLVLLAAGIATFILSKKLDAPPQVSRHRSRRRKSLIRRYS